jgi:hypothetical protein
VHRFSISETTVVYEAQMEGEPAVGSDPEWAIEVAYPAVMQMHGPRRRDGRIETQEHAAEAIDHPVA